MSGCDFWQAPRSGCDAKAILAALGLMVVSVSASAQAQSDEDFAKQLSNPVASLISVPFQFNCDDNIGADRNGHKFLLTSAAHSPVWRASLNRATRQ